MSAMTSLDIGAAFMYVFLFFSLYFEVFLLVSFIERRRRSAATVRPGTSHLPSVCIVVPCYNEARTVESTLRSLLQLDYPQDLLEFVVVDDGSQDNTYAIASGFLAAHSEAAGRMRLLRKENGGKHTAMNLALSMTNAELIACLDADSLVEPAALREMAPLFSDPRIAAVTPSILVRKPQTFMQHMQNVEYRLSIFNRFILAALGAVFITPGAFSVLRTSTVRALGGWRYAHSTEDMEMALRLQKAGHMIANAPRAVVHTATPRTLRALYKQRVRWTYGWLRNAADYHSMIGNRTYGTLSALVLPAALVSIAAAIYFFARVLWSFGENLMHAYVRYSVVGAHAPSFSGIDPFFFNTSAILMLIWVSVAIILILISIGSHIGTGSRKLPLATPLFVAFYSFLVPLWLSAAVIRAAFKTGVTWR